MNQIKIKSVWLLCGLFFCAAAVPAASRTAVLQAKVYGGGQISLEDGQKLRALIYPKLYSKDFKDTFRFVLGPETTDRDHLTGSLLFAGGVTVSLDGSVQPVKNGLKITYVMVPSAPLTLAQVCASVNLFYNDWLGASCQLAAQKLTVTPDLMKQPHQDPQPVIVLGPAVDPAGLSLKMEGDPSLEADVEDDRQWHLPGESRCWSTLELRMDTDKDKKGPLEWKAGEAKTISFTLTFNRPVHLSEKIQNTLNREKVWFETLYNCRVPLSLDYSVPEDAKTLDAFLMPSPWGVDPVSNCYLLVPGEFSIGGLKGKASNHTEGWMMWDTGTHTSFHEGDRPLNPALITDEFLVKLGFNPKPKLTETIKFPEGQRKQAFTFLLNNADSDVGPVKTLANLGGWEVRDLPLCSLDIQNFKQKRFEKLDVAGYLPMNLIGGYLFSVDYKNQKIYLRPGNSLRRTFFKEAPAAQMDCQVVNGSIYVPITINETIQGLGWLDTGNYVTRVDSGRTHLGKDDIHSFAVGAYAATDPAFKPLLVSHHEDGIFEDFGKDQTKIAWLGNDVFTGRFVTFDLAREKNIH